MKENSLDSHRGKVAESKAGAAAKQETTSATNFDDDYNEWELGIGDLIIDLDADIEKNNEKSVSGQGTGGGAGAHPIVQPQQAQQQQPPQSQTQQQASATAGATTTFSMASAKGGRMNSATVEHHATVDKGLKMKIKRTKPTKTSEAKHEIVKSDTKPASPVEAVNGTSPVAATPNAVDSKSKHVSSKGRGGSHREKKDRTKDKEKSVSSSKVADVNGVMNPVSSAALPPPTATIKLTSSSVNMASISSPTVNLGIPTSVVSLSLTNSSNTPSVTSNSAQHSGSTTNSQPSMPTLSVKLDPKFPIIPNNSFPAVKTEDISRSVPAKRMRTNQEKPDKPVEKVSPPVDGTTSPRPPEMQDICIGTSVGTITDPDCLGPCEPGTSVTLEGIVWHETEGGVLVVNVTWRGKTYVGTLLDCTKHDWAPPRFCESPTSDVETRTPKGRGKRGRGGNSASVDMTNYTETRSSVHSKLRNPGKGRRANAPFPSPVKTEGSPIVGMKRKGRPPELELRESELRTSKRSRSQSRGASTNSSTPPEHPSSPVLIECPKPNCKKRYRHINGLRYHQAHAHHESGSGVEDSLDEQTKDLSSDNEESTLESASVPQSPGATSEKNVRSSPRPFTGKAPPPPEKKSLSNPPPTSTPSLAPTPSPTPTNSEAYPPPTTLPCAPAAAVTSAVTIPVASDLNTLATVAVSDSKTTVKVSGVLRFGQASPRQATTIAAEGDPVTTLSTPPIALPVTPSSAAVTTTIAATPNATSVQGSQRVGAAAPPSPASQVYQFTHAPIGSLTTTTVSTVRSPTTTSTVSVAATNITSTTSVCSPPAVSANFNAAAATMDKQKIKPEKPDKLKLKPPQSMPVPGLRPVGPPTVNPQMVGGVANLAVSPQQPTLVPGAVPVHPNLAASLKPIQPKVNIMGEVNAASQVLDGPKKEKSKHKKKSKDKEKERKLGEISPSQPESKSQGLESMDKLNGNVYSKMSDILLKEGVGEQVSPHLQNPNYPMTPLARNVESPLEVSTGDGANTANENVQSPAYSDISDANDTAPVLESEVPSKEKEEEKAKVPSEPTPPPAHNLGPYGMYYSYRQPPYLVPSVPAQSSAQPAVVSGQVPPTDKVKENSMDKVEVRMKEQQKQWNEREQAGGGVSATAEVDKKDGSGNSASGVAANQTNMSEYQLQQQKLLQQQYAYQYGYSYPYSMDPTYHMQYMSDPQLKQQLEKCMEERERFYKDPFEQRQKQSSPKEPVDKNKIETVKVKVEAEKRKACPTTEQLMKHVQQQMPVTAAVGGKEREQRMPSQANKLDATANPSLKEKQNENHQILKENIELKTQMDNKAKYDRFDTSKYDQLMYRPDDVQRYYQQMYQEKYMDQQPKLDGSRRKDDSLVPKPSPNEKSHCPAKDPTKQPPPSSHTSSLPMSSPKTPSGPPKEPLALKEAVKKETASVVDVTKSAEGSDAKDKRERDADRTKQSEGQKPTMETQGPPPPTSSYAYMHPSYMQSSPYSTIPFDHSVYRNMLMTPGPYPSSPYLHPQMRYHVPQAEPQPDMTPKLHPSGPTKALDLLQHHASQYYTHKIHELQERALKSPPPAVIQPATNTKAVESSSVIKSDATTPAGPHEQRRSPPLQRHLHTHHHTHVGVGVGVGYPIIGQYDPYASKPLIRH